MNPPSLFELLLVGLLAVYRLTFMLNQEAGPAHIFERFRTRIGVTYDQYSNPQGSNWRAEAILCFYCLSVWMAFGVVALVVIALLANRLDLAVLILLPFAMSGGAIFMKKWAG